MYALILDEKINILRLNVDNIISMYNFRSMESHLLGEKVERQDIIWIGVDMNLNAVSLTTSNIVTDLIKNWCKAAIKWPGDQGRVNQIQDFLQRPDITIKPWSFPKKRPNTIFNRFKEIFTWPHELNIPEKIYIRTKVRLLLWHAPSHIIYPDWSYSTPFGAFLLELWENASLKEFPELMS